MRGQPSLFDFEFDNPGTYEEFDRCAAQEEILGICVDIHPLEKYTAQIQAAGAISTLAAADNLSQRVRVAGIRQSLHRSRTTNGEWMAFLSLEDMEGILDVIIFPNIYRRVQATIADLRQPVIVEGIMETDSNGQEPYLRAERIEPIQS